MVLPGVTIGEKFRDRSRFRCDEGYSGKMWLPLALPARFTGKSMSMIRSIISETDDLMSSRRESKRADKENR